MLKSLHFISRISSISSLFCFLGFNERASVWSFLLEQLIMMGVTGAPRRRRGEIGFSERRQTILGEGFIIFYRALSGQFRCHNSVWGQQSRNCQICCNTMTIWGSYILCSYVMLCCEFAALVLQLKTMLLITAAATALSVLLVVCRSAEGQRW